MPSRYSLAVLPLAGVRAAIGICRGALTVRLAFAVCIAGVRHTAGLSRFGGVTNRNKIGKVSSLTKGNVTRERHCPLLFSYF